MAMHTKRVDRSDTQNTLPGDSHRSVAKSISTENKFNILVVCTVRLYVRVTFCN